jgi:hypothetical protein
MQLVSTVTVGAGGASSIEFTSIPQTGTDLLLVISGRSANAVIPDSIYGTVNSNASGYANRSLEGSGSGASSNTYGASGFIFNAGVAGNSTTSSSFSNASVYIPNYTSSLAKSFSFDGVVENNATTAGQSIQAASWSGTSAISSIQLYVGGGGNFSQHSTFSLYTITKA